MALDRSALRASEQDHARIQLVLRAGLIASTVLLLGGLLATGATAVDDGDIPPVSRTAIMLGVVVLTATPCVRVLALVAVWTRERDWRFVAVALAVVAALTLALALGENA